MFDFEYLDHKLIPDLYLLNKLTMKSMRDEFKLIRWEARSRILWAYDDRYEALFMMKIENERSLDMLPEHSIAIKKKEYGFYELRDDMDLSKLPKLSELYRSMISPTKACYDISMLGCLNAIAGAIKNITNGRIRMKSLSSIPEARFERLELQENGIRLLTPGRLQLVATFRHESNKFRRAREYYTSDELTFMPFMDTEQTAP